MDRGGLPVVVTAIASKKQAAKHEMIISFNNSAQLGLAINK